MSCTYVRVCVCLNDDYDIFIYSSSNQKKKRRYYSVWMESRYFKIVIYMSCTCVCVSEYELYVCVCLNDDYDIFFFKSKKNVAFYESKLV